jgi:hypothetical protein
VPHERPLERAISCQPVVGTIDNLSGAGRGPLVSALLLPCHIRWNTPKGMYIY